MQMAITFMAVVGGLIFSLAVALLAEEIIFGQVFRLFFTSGKLASGKFASGRLARQTVAVKSAQQR
jgi:ABC-type enterobactin transport system permease subunit